MPRANPVGRTVAASPSYDYPRATSSDTEIIDSEQEQQPLLDSQTLEDIDQLRERLETTDTPETETWSRSAQRTAEAYIRQARARVAAARLPEESHARSRVQPNHPPSNSRSRMRRVLSNIHDTESAFQEADPYPPTRGSANRRWRADLNRRHMSHRMRDSESAALHEHAERLAQRNEDINTLIASTPDLPPRHGVRRPRSVSFDTSPQQDRRKRRRIEDTAVEVKPKIEYGWWGQVVPGKLQMHVVSSDSQPLDLKDCSKSFAAENILRDDPTIHCTTGSACNIVLSHEGDTPFSLERLVIKAPTLDYTDSAQEGLVFVSMQRDEKFSRTTSYKILHFSESYFGRFYPQGKNHKHRSSTSSPSWPALEPAHAGPVPRATAVSGRDQIQVDSNACADESSDESYIGLEVDDESGSDTSDTSNSSQEDSPEPRQRADTPVTYRAFFEEERLRDELSASRRQDPSYAQRSGRFPRDRHQQQLERDIEQIVAQGEQTRADRLDRRLNRSNAAAAQQSHVFPPPPAALRRGFAQRLQHEAESNRPTQSYHPRDLDATDQALYRDSVLDIGRSGSTTSPLPHADHLRPRSLDIGREPLPSLDPSAWNGHPVSLSGGPARSVANRVASPLHNVAGVNDLQSETEGDNIKVLKDSHLLAPAARFSLRQRSKKNSSTDDSDNTMTIQFDPPISGKYILLKLWNPPKDRNIDIQHVAAYGFAGPRYFPAWEFA